jgi:hypothetical protein
MKDLRSTHGIPLALMLGAASLGERPAWPAAAALDVLRWMHRNGWAVAAVELWRAPAAGDEGPRRLARSEYDGERHGEAWTDYVERCAEGARTFLRYYAAEPEAMFTLDWRTSA